MKIKFLKHDDFVPSLGELSLSHQILFAASICERTLPLYTSIDFEDNFNHQNFPILRKILDYIWVNNIRESLDKTRVQNFIDSCSKIIAETIENEYCLSEESHVPDLISSTLSLALTGDINYLREVIVGVHHILWYSLNYHMEQEEEIAGDNSWESKTLDEHYEIIENHYLTKREMQKEMDDWIALKNTPNLTKEFIEQFRAAANLNGKGILERSNTN